MASQQQQSSKQPLYPQVIDSNPDINSPFLSSPSAPPTSTTTPSMYPSIDMKDLAENLFPDTPEEEQESTNVTVEETLVRIPNTILHLIDKTQSVELATGDFTITRLRQSSNSIALLARIGHHNENWPVQWPITRDQATVKLDTSHYFFSLNDNNNSNDSPLNYGLTVPAKGQETTLESLDGILNQYSSFSVQKVEGKVRSEVLDGTVAVKEKSEAYWTTLAPNVEDYSGSVARGIANGSGRVIQGILWCGDVTVDRLKWGEEFMKRRLEKGEKPSEVSKDALKRMKRVKRVTQMTESVATGILSGVLKVSGFFTSSLVNSKAGKKFFGLLPGEIVLASLDGFAKICDAAEMAGKNVLQTSSVVTTGLVSHRYGEQAAEVTNHGLGAAGHAFGTAWAVFKIRKAFNPKSAVKPSSLAKSAVKTAAAELKGKKGKQ